MPPTGDIELVCRRLLTYGFALKAATAISLFGQDGQMEYHLSQEAGSLEVWEIDPAHEAALREIPWVNTVRIVDPHLEVLNKAHHGQYDLVLLDNPPNTYSPEKRPDPAGPWCEHFEILPGAMKLLRPDGGVVAFNVIWKTPADYDKFPLWQERRQAFYDLWDAAQLSMDDVLQHYRFVFHDNGWQPKLAFEQPRLSGFVSLVVFWVQPL